MYLEQPIQLVQILVYFFYVFLSQSYHQMIVWGGTIKIKDLCGLRLHPALRRGVCEAIICRTIYMRHRILPIFLMSTAPWRGFSTAWLTLWSVLLLLPAMAHMAVSASFHHVVTMRFHFSCSSLSSNWIRFSHFLAVDFVTFREPVLFRGSNGPLCLSFLIFFPFLQLNLSASFFSLLNMLS